MSLRAGRLVVAVPLTELLAIVGMMAPAVGVFAMLNATVTARMFAMQALSLWVAPVAGFVFCLLGAWWVGRGLSRGHERNGLALGVAVAIIDLGLLVASGAPVGVLMVSSVVSRIAGAYAGGVIAKRRAARRHLEGAVSAKSGTYAP